MAEGNLVRRRLRAALPLLFLLVPGCQSVPSRKGGSSGGLEDGPTRWLMLPEEQRRYRHIHSTREAVDFNETFWKRRDPDPGRPGNEFARAFYERVEAADRLYAEGGVRGSLTDRGRALILLGPPPVLRYGEKKVPAYEPGRPGSPSNVRSRELMLETWIYPLADLPLALTRQVQEDDPDLAEVTLVFAADSRSTNLIEGDRYLEMAVRAAVHDPGE